MCREVSRPGCHTDRRRFSDRMSLLEWRALSAAFPPVFHGVTMHMAVHCGDWRPSGVWKGLSHFLCEFFPDILLPRPRFSHVHWANTVRRSSGLQHQDGAFPPWGSPEKIVNHASCCKEINILKFLQSGLHGTFNFHGAKMLMMSSIIYATNPGLARGSPQRPASEAGKRMTAVSPVHATALFIVRMETQPLGLGQGPPCV